MKKERKSLIFTLSAVLLWSTVATAFKLTLRGMTPYRLLFWASLTSTIFLAPLAYLTDKTCFFRQFRNKHFLIRNIFFGFLNPFLYYLLLFKSYELLPAQEAQPLNYTWPIAISLFSVLFLNEKFNARIFFGLLISFFGIIVIATRGNFSQLHFQNINGTAMALGSAIIWGAFWVLKIKDKRKEEIKLFASFFFGSLFSFLFLLLSEQFVLPSKVYLLGSIYIGLFEMGLTFFLWIKGLSISENKAKTSTLAYFSPFISLLFIAFFLNEKIRLSSILGLIFIVGGIVLQNASKIKKSAGADF